MAYVQNFGSTDAKSMGNLASNFLADQKKRNILRTNAKERLKTLNNAFGVDSDYHVTRQGGVQVGNKDAFALEKEDMSRGGVHSMNTTKVADGAERAAMLANATKEDEGYNYALDTIKETFGDPTQGLQGNKSANPFEHAATFEQLSQSNNEAARKASEYAMKLRKKNGMTEKEAFETTKAMYDATGRGASTKFGGPKVKSGGSLGDSYKSSINGSMNYEAEGRDLYKTDAVNKAGFKDNLGVSMRSLLLNQALTDAQNTVASGYGAETTNQFDDLVEMRKQAVDQYNQTIAKDQVTSGFSQGEAEKVKGSGSISATDQQDADVKHNSTIDMGDTQVKVDNSSGSKNDGPKEMELQLMSAIRDDNGKVTGYNNDTNARVYVEGDKVRFDQTTENLDLNGNNLGTLMHTTRLLENGALVKGKEVKGQDDWVMKVSDIDSKNKTGWVIASRKNENGQMEQIEFRVDKNGNPIGRAKVPRGSYLPKSLVDNVFSVGRSDIKVGENPQ